MAQTGFPRETFYETQKLNPYWSSWTCFTEVIRNKKYLKRPTIRKWVGKLVDKSDYSKSETRELHSYLYRLVNGLED